MIANLTDLHLWVKEQKTDNPELAEEIQDMYQLCLDEIEQGESISNEIEHCIEAIVQLIEGDD